MPCNPFNKLPSDVALYLCHTLEPIDLINVCRTFTEAYDILKSNTALQQKLYKEHQHDIHVHLWLDLHRWVFIGSYPLVSQYPYEDHHQTTTLAIMSTRPSIRSMQSSLANKSLSSPFIDWMPLTAPSIPVELWLDGAEGMTMSFPAGATIGDLMRVMHDFEPTNRESATAGGR